MHFTKIYLYPFLKARSSFDSHKVPIISVWKAQQSPSRKGSRCFHIRDTICKIYWKPPSSTRKYFWKSENIICQRSWSVAGIKMRVLMSRMNDLLWPLQQRLSNLKNFPSLQRNVHQQWCLNIIYTLEDFKIVRIFYSPEICTTWVPSGSTSAEKKVWTSKEEAENQDVQRKSLLLILIMSGVTQLHSVNRKGYQDSYPRCC